MAGSFIFWGEVEARKVSNDVLHWRRWRAAEERMSSIATSFSAVLREDGGIRFVEGPGIACMWIFCRELTVPASPRG